MSMSLNSIHKLWTKLDDESDNKLQQQTIIYYNLVYVKDRPILVSSWEKKRKRIAAKNYYLFVWLMFS